MTVDILCMARGRLDDLELDLDFENLCKACPSCFVFLLFFLIFPSFLVVSSCRDVGERVRLVNSRVKLAINVKNTFFFKRVGPVRRV